MRVVVIAASVFLVFSVNPSIAEKKSNKPMLENLAALSLAARWCENYVVDLKSALSISLGQNINPLKPPHEAIFDEAKEKLEKIMSEGGVTNFCTVTYERFRPGGEVPGFMMRK